MCVRGFEEWHENESHMQKYEFYFITEISTEFAMSEGMDKNSK